MRGNVPEAGAEQFAAIEAALSRGYVSWRSPPGWKSPDIVTMAAANFLKSADLDRAIIKDDDDPADMFRALSALRLALTGRHALPEDNITASIEFVLESPAMRRRWTKEAAEVLTVQDADNLTEAELSKRRVKAALQWVERQVHEHAHAKTRTELYRIKHDPSIHCSLCHPGGIQNPQCCGGQRWHRGQAHKLEVLERILACFKQSKDHGFRSAFNSWLASVDDEDITVDRVIRKADALWNRHQYNNAREGLYRMPAADTSTEEGKKEMVDFCLKQLKALGHKVADEKKGNTQAGKSDGSRGNGHGGRGNGGGSGPKGAGAYYNPLFVAGTHANNVSLSQAQQDAQGTPMFPLMQQGYMMSPYFMPPHGVPL